MKNYHNAIKKKSREFRALVDPESGLLMIHIFYHCAIKIPSILLSSIIVLISLIRSYSSMPPDD